MTIKTAILSLFAILLLAISSIAFADEVAVPKQEFNALSEALKLEKSFVLAVRTGFEGEHQIGNTKAFVLKNSKSVFYIADVCDNRFCQENYPLIVEGAKNFVAEYNSLIGKEEISFSEEKGDIPIRLVTSINRGGNGRWKCKSISNSRQSRCFIQVIPDIDRVNLKYLIGHEMLNVLGFNDTKNRLYEDCLLFDGPRYRGSKFKSLCDIEKRTILFSREHLRAGMNLSGISNAFDKHWKPSEKTFQLAEKLEEIYNSSNSAEEKFLGYCRIYYPQAYTCEAVFRDKPRLNRYCRIFRNPAFCDGLISSKKEKKTFFSRGGSK